MRGGLAVLFGIVALLHVACASTPDDVRGANEAAQTGATAEPGNRTKFGTEFGPISTFDLREGDCFNPSVSVTDPFEVLLVPCKDFWEFQVLTHLPVDEAVQEWPGDDYFVQQSEAQCSLTTVLVFYPSEDSWFLGDRSLYCMRGR
jgi:hypothetical protein